ncbi:C4-dicarboxylate transporter DctA [Candidatus Liberibacter americanus]|uniref:C4-dicarboxylate transport protein n=1 Tax=Candidatus Liberibacter americanus str. Sao Paulo TaxID=1261131 RepID=U6B7G3_9HYPH|nr:C4-dicarboxylate transporter DctA [Candidatus Liberibacter americanus]AHA27677.1 Na+/H+-dicarboxylate symporter [Candidatus Liberibacter americanus str. Sao Paulo]EMS36385.1 C4-dicarboxylate transporter DctA [Candidatus Liberibacter americanus PW_SP]
MEKSINISKKASIPLYKHLYLQVVIAIITGVSLGYFYPQIGIQMQSLGEIFISITKMLITPVIFLTVATGISRMTNMQGVSRIFWKSMLVFFICSMSALIIGLFVANIAKPGAGMNVDLRSLDTEMSNSGNYSKHEETFIGFIKGIIPKTLLSALTSGNILQTLFVALLFGISLSLVGEKSKNVRNALEEMNLPVFKMVSILMKFAPVGAFGSMAFTIGKYGLSSISNLIYLIVCLYATSAFFILIILGIVARLCNFSVMKLIFYLKDEILLVFSTSSSESALPGLVKKMEEVGCHRSVVSITVPTGYSFNLDGSNIYITLAALFIAQATNIALSIEEQISLLLIAIISSKGAAGVTGAAFTTLAATITMFPTLPIGGMTLILGVDRFLSECRSVTNFIGNAVVTVVISKWENKVDQDTLNKHIGIK